MTTYTDEVNIYNPEAIAAVSAAANSAAYNEQYIYISKPSGTTSQAGTTTWVEESGNVQNTWTTKRPTYSSDYPVLFVAKQKKPVSGSVTCTTPVKDDTTTVIDGGHVTTGTIDAARISTTVINAINANVSDTINADKINVSQLIVGQEQVDGLDETLKELIPTSLSQLENDSGYVDASFVPDEIPVANIHGQLTIDKIDVDSLRAALLQVASLLIGSGSGCHIEASGQRMSFKDGGGSEVAYIAVDANGKSTFYMTRSMVVEDMQFGSGLWKWYKRDNNNMSLKWMGGM